MDLNVADLRRLSDLLKVEDESSDSDDDLPKTGLANFGPGHIGTGKKNSVETGKLGTEEGPKNFKNKDIWDEREIPEGIIYDESDDPREKPEFEIKYKQAVTAEEMFLQMGGKTPASFNCEEIVVYIKLPKENREAVDLEVKKQVLELRSPKYRLSLPLPHPVDQNRAKAVWELEQLRVTLRVEREFDFDN